MKRTAFTIATVAVLLASTACVVAESKTDPNATTLTGGFVWEGGGSSGDLEAVFTPTETDGEWTVAFHFEFRGKPHTYKGSATGSLTEGTLAGSVKNENKRRTFTFEGSFADGKFTGTHAEDGSRTGTLTLGG